MCYLFFVNIPDDFEGKNASGVCLLVISFLSVIALLLGPDKAQCGKTELKKDSKNQRGLGATL